MNSDRLRVGVFGASGFVGTALVRRLSQSGHHVEAFSAPRLQLSIHATEAEIRKSVSQHESAIEDLAQQLSGLDIVINAAGAAKPDAAADTDLFGANSLLPVYLASACLRADVKRFIHISSAAVQGRRRVLDESYEVAPFSPYSESKAKGELALRAWSQSVGFNSPETVIVRATSVQGEGRVTTGALARFARSPFAFVAHPGTQPTVVSSLLGLAEFVEFVAAHSGSIPEVVLQPWEGSTLRSVMLNVGGKEPRLIPASLCRLIVAIGYGLDSALLRGRMQASVRRMEVAILGQLEAANWATLTGFSHKAAEP